MAIGGMIGGGIFAVLGVVIDLAGHLAVVSFVAGGALALVTAHSYARLTLAYDEAGGSFTYLRRGDHPAAAGSIAWLLILGYVFTIAVYAFTFGHYVANALGGSDVFARLAGLAIIGLFIVVNLRGVSTAGLVEDVVVLGKLIVLGVVAAVGLSMFSSERVTPIADQGLLGLFIGSAVIFMAYEGFQLLAYDYDELERPHRTLPRALYISVAVVIGTYVIVTLGSQMLLSDASLIAEKEVALAAVGQEALGTFGLALVTLGAVLSTSSAINATLFATARLTRDVSSAGELPRALARARGQVPRTAIVVLGVAAAGFSLMPGIGQLVAFGSLTFLLVFAVVNYLHARRTATRLLEQALAYVGATGSLAAALVLIAYLASNDLAALIVIGVCFATLIPARGLFQRHQRRNDRH
jgi:amino acid transporter